MVLISIDDPALDPAAKLLGESVDYVRKQDLRPRGLRRLWESRRA